MNEKNDQQEELNADGVKATEIVSDLSKYALVRTALSSERSLMAWIRTSVSLYSFGFTMIKFVDYLERRGEDSQFSDGPRRLGLVLIGMGILVLVMAVFEHLRRIMKMNQLGLPPLSRVSLPVAAATALFVIGVVTVIGIGFHWPS